MPFINRIVLTGALFSLALFSSAQQTAPAPAQTAELDDVVDASLNRLNNNRQSQQQLDVITSDVRQMEQAYLQELSIKEGLDVYNLMLQKQLNNQQKQLDQLQNSLANASLIERQVMPLLVRMVSALEELVVIDLPFLSSEREQRIAELTLLLERPELTLAEKTRRVFEAYQIEMEYGYTIESYKQEIELDGQSIAADILRIGRIALLFQDINGNRVGHWQPETNAWELLEESQFRRHINKGLRIAKEEIAPELVTIPFSQPVEAIQ